MMFVARCGRPMRSLVPLLVVAAGAGRLAAQGIDQQARTRSGVVAAAHPLAAMAGRRMLDEGGNAADAATAAAFAVAVVLPEMNSIGGRNQILVRHADGTVSGIDGTTQVPRDYDPATAPKADHGYATVGIPGVVAGLMRLHKEHGSLSLAVVMAPAIEYAERGFRMLPGQERNHERVAEDLAETDGARRSFIRPEGGTYRAGDLLVQRDLAKTLRRIAADGGESFYRGDLARTMAADIQGNGGFVTRRDLADYRAETSRVVRGTYRGYDLVGLDVPAAGAVTIQALQIMERFDRASMSAPGWAAVTAQAIRIASGELGGLGSDSAALRATSKDWARRMAETVRLPGMGPAAATAGGDRPDEEGHFTTHIVVADSAGMLVSLTQTVGPIMGSRVATKGLGVHYAATLGGYLSSIEAGARARSFVSPFLVLKDGEPFLVVGAAGGSRIPAAIVQVISRVIDDGMDVAEAMAAPRVFMPSDTLIEMETSAPGWRPAAVEAVRGFGFRVRAVPAPGSFARAQVLRFRKDAGEWEAVSEPDDEGMALGAVRRAPR
ncbi:MAG: gamma-glutamyltransferase [Gemmatimonadales bacterium]